MTVQFSQRLGLPILAACISLTTASPGAAQTGTAEPGRQQVTTFKTSLGFIRSAVFDDDNDLLEPCLPRS